MSARRSVLFVHQNFPGQFPRIAQALIERGDRVAAIGSGTARGLPGVDLRRWTNARGSTPGILDHAVRAEADLIRADAALRAAAQLAKDGFTPDLIVANPGWGETLHLKELWPHARVALLVEYWYGADGTDVGFDPEFGPPPDLAARAALNARNLGQALACAQADLLVCPTRFQASVFPERLRERIVVHHEGIDTARAAAVPPRAIRLPDGAVLDGSRPIVTFVARTLEPLRGIHMLLRALPALMASHPAVEVVVMGDERGNGYGLSPPPGRTWKELFLAEVADRIDARRLHFTGRVEHQAMIQLFSQSTAHIYLTYPFTLSWSLLEAMACGCLIVASDTAPVRDAIEAGRTGLLVPFFAPDRLAAEVGAVLDQPTAHRPLREAARRDAVARFDARTHGVPGWVRLLDACG